MMRMVPSAMMIQSAVPNPCSTQREKSTLCSINPVRQQKREQQPTHSENKYEKWHTINLEGCGTMMIPKSFEIKKEQNASIH